MNERTFRIPATIEVTLGEYEGEDVLGDDVEAVRRFKEAFDVYSSGTLLEDKELSESTAFNFYVHADVLWAEPGSDAAIVAGLRALLDERALYEGTHHEDDTGFADAVARLLAPPEQS